MTCPKPVGRGLDGGYPEHWVVDKRLGTFREVAEEGGSGPDLLSKVLPSGGTGGDHLWGGNMGFDGNDAAKNLKGYLWVSCGRCRG